MLATWIWTAWRKRAKRYGRRSAQQRHAPVIDEHGNVVQVRVLSGHPLLIDAALKAVLQWKYEPTTLNGQPVSVELQVQVHFNLNS